MHSRRCSEISVPILAFICACISTLSLAEKPPTANTTAEMSESLFMVLVGGAGRTDIFKVT